MNVNFSWNNVLKYLTMNIVIHVCQYSPYFIIFIIIIQMCKQNIGSAFFVSGYKNQDKY